MSGAVKSTASSHLADRLRAINAKLETLNGDVVRTHLCKDLGFSKQDRDENIRRIGFVSRLLSRNGVIVIVAAVSPYREIRYELKQEIPNFVEIYMQCPLDVLIERDVKGLYKKGLPVRSRTSPGFPTRMNHRWLRTLPSAPQRKPPEEGVEKIWAYLQARKLISVEMPAAVPEGSFKKRHPLH